MCLGSPPRERASEKLEFLGGANELRIKVERSTFNTFNPKLEKKKNSKQVVAGPSTLEMLTKRKVINLKIIAGKRCCVVNPIKTFSN